MTKASEDVQKQAKKRIAAKRNETIDHTFQEMTDSLGGRWDKLTLAQKILLAETGTVEQVLSILAGSTIEVKVLKQEIIDGTILRQTVLSANGVPLVKAKSKIYYRFLPARIVHKIIERKQGIGAIIHNAELETCRKIVRIGIGSTGHPYRIYNIIHAGKVVFKIREDIWI